MTLSSISTACDAMLAPNQPIGVSDAFGEIDICAAHGTPSGEDLGAMRGALSGQPQDPELHLSGSISVHAFAQLTFRESLRDIEACLRSQTEKLYHMGIRGQVSRNTLANANATRDWRIYADFAQRLIGIARKLYINEPFGVDLANTAYALDSTTIDLSLSLFPWAPFRTTKAAVKMHTLLDLRGNIPSFIHISDGKLHDVNILDQLIPEAGAFYVMDRGYIDFQRLYRLHQAGSFYVTRAKRNMDAQRRYSHPTDRSTGVIYDQ